jgi:hypothetical protein
MNDRGHGREHLTYRGSFEIAVVVLVDGHATGCDRANFDFERSNGLGNHGLSHEKRRALRARTG